MASIIWCAKVRQIVEESRSDIERAITNVRRQRDPRTAHLFSYDSAGNEVQHAPLMEPPGFIFVTPIGMESQRLLAVDHISSIEAVPGDGI